MSKVTLNDLANLQNENTAVATINNNNNTIETAFENTLSRGGAQPNQMEADFDMNSHDILNADDIRSLSVHTNHLYVNGGEVIHNLDNIPDGDIFANISGVLNTPSGNTLTSILDHDISTIAGTILARNTSAWQAMAPGTAGDVLTSQGPGNNLKYVHITGGGDMLSGNNGVDFENLADTRINLNIYPLVRTVSDLQNFDVANGFANLCQIGREGLFQWRSADFSSYVTSDTQQGIFIASNNVASTSGAWVRVIVSPLNVRWYGAVGDGTTDDRIAVQAAVSAINNGYSSVLYFPSGFDFRIVNATGNGSTLVDKRADAVLNNTIYPLTITASKVNVLIEGTVSATSALGDLFKFTNNYNRVYGGGIVRNTSGDFNATNSVDATLQWHATILNFTGDFSYVTNITVLDQPTIGVWFNSNNNLIYGCRLEGGPTFHAHDGETVQFAVMCGGFSGGQAINSVIGNIFGRSYPGNGAAYDCVFSVSTYTMIANNQMFNFLEHGIYNYGTNSIIANNLISNGSADPESVSCLQSIADNVIISGNDLTGWKNNINFLSGNNSCIVNNKCGSITVRTYASTETAVFNLLIANNNIIVTDATSQGQVFWPIDINVDVPFQNIRIIGNQTNGGGDWLGGQRGAIFATTASGTSSGLQIKENTVGNCIANAIYVSNCDAFEIGNNSIFNSNISTDSVAIRGANCTSGRIYNNRVFDTRGAGATIDTICYFATGDSNSYVNAYSNVLSGGKVTSTPLCVIPTNSERRWNTLNNIPITGTFGTQNSSSWDVATGCTRLGSAATILINPIDAASTQVQAGVHALSGAPGDSKITITTADGNATGTVGGTFFYEVVQ